MQSSPTACPSCGDTNMIFGGHHGMEHNVCESCGTVVECDQFTVDIYQKGLKEVSPDYDGTPATFGSSSRWKIYNQKSRLYRESLQVMNRLMDGLNLTVPVRKAATEFLTYTSRLNKLASVGACVYLAMKDFNMPVTIRYISNYLQVSHFLIGRMMRKLEKRLGSQRQGTNIFGVDELIPLIFSQANFGVVEERKRMLNLILDKTEKFIHLLQECQATTGYEPHLMILAAGYLVWKSLNIHNWDELNLDKEKLPRRPSQILSVAMFLSEMGIQISNQGTLTTKIALLTDLLYKLAEQIPWLSVKKPSKKTVVFHLNDFLKYKSQIIDMTAREMGKEKKVNLKMDDPETKEEKEEDKSDSFNGSLSPLNSCFQSASAAHVIDDVSDDVDQTCGNAPPLSKEGCSQSVHDPKFGYGSDASCQKLPYRKLRFTKVKDILKFPPRKRSNVETRTKGVGRKEEPAPNAETKSNGYNQLLKVTHPMLAQSSKRKRKPLLCNSDSENPCLLFP